jgi:hypothetical protein
LVTIPPKSAFLHGSFFCRNLPIAELDYFDLTPTPPVNQHFDLMAGEVANGFVGERYYGDNV